MRVASHPHSPSSPICHLSARSAKIESNLKLHLRQVSDDNAIRESGRVERPVRRSILWVLAAGGLVPIFKAATGQYRCNGMHRNLSKFEMGVIHSIALMHYRELALEPPIGEVSHL